MKRFTLLTLVFAMFMIISCEKDEPSEEIYMGTAYVGQSIPIGTKYSYSEGSNWSSVSFIDKNSYTWGQGNVNDGMTMTVQCEYNTTTGEFSDSIEITGGDGNNYGATNYFPISFCIVDMNKMYLLTVDMQNDTNLTFPRTIAEKITGSEGTLEGSYQSSYKLNGWISNADGFAGTIIEAEVNYTYSAGTFSGTYSERIIAESTLSMPDYGIEIGTIDSTRTINFSGTWEYNKADNTISETITSPIVKTETYTPYWVSYNDKLYLVTSLTRFYQKENTGN